MYELIVIVHEPHETKAKIIKYADGKILTDRRRHGMEEICKWYYKSNQINSNWNVN